MKYILKTEVNESGNLVFSKQRNGKSFIYLAKDETGATATVDKDWILQNQKNIVNLGVSNDSIYPVEVEKSSVVNEGNTIRIKHFKYGDKRSVLEVYSTVTDKGQFDGNIEGIKLVANGNVVSILKNFYYGTSDDSCGSVLFELNSPKKIRHYTYRTSWDKICDELKESKVCLYTDKSNYSGPENYILMDISYVDIQNCSFEVQKLAKKFDELMEVTFKAYINGKSSSGDKICIKQSCLTNHWSNLRSEHSEDLGKIMKNYAQLLPLLENKVVGTFALQQYSELIKNALDCITLLGSKYCYWLNEINPVNLKNRALSRAKKGDFSFIGRIGYEEDIEAKKARKELDEIMQKLREKNGGYIL